jgi:hypothetical protein
MEFYPDGGSAFRSLQGLMYVRKNLPDPPLEAYPMLD